MDRVFLPPRFMPRASRTSDAKRKSYESRFDLGALFEFSTIVNGSVDLKFILGHFLLTIMGKLLSLRGIVLLLEKKGTYRVHNIKGLPSELVGTALTIRSLPNRIVYTDRLDVRKYPWAGFFREHGIRLLAPLISGDSTLGIAGFAPTSVKKRLLTQETTYVRSLANIAASAIARGIAFEELNQANRRLNGKIQELNTLFELSKEFNAVLDADRLIKLLMFSVMGQIGAKRYFLCLRRNGRMESVASRLDQPLAPAAYQMFKEVETACLVRSLTKKSDRQFQSTLMESGIQALVPLQLQNEMKGVLGLGEKIHGGEYSQTDLEFLSSLGNLAIISLENARLFREAIEKQKLEDELLIAKEIQRGLLPATIPVIPNFEIAATNISSKQVGGDYYDVIQLSSHRFVLAIGDVSGKGTPASLLMANLQATIRALVPLGLSLSELTKRVNDLICDNTGSDRFITFFWGILDTESRKFRYVSAGHNPPIVLHCDGRMEKLDKGGIILGIMKTPVPYEEGEIEFQTGDLLVLFTDGVTEAMNTAGEEWGDDQLEALIQRHAGDSPLDLQMKIVNGIRDHSKLAPQSDDITLLVLKAL